MMKSVKTQSIYSYIEGDAGFLVSFFLMELAWLLEGCISFAFPSEKTQFVYFGMEERGQVLSYVTFICIKASSIPKV